MLLKMAPSLTLALLSFHGAAVFAHANTAFTNIQVEQRPYFLIADMSPSPLKDKPQSCANGPFTKTDFSIDHPTGREMHKGLHPA
jgi:glycerophosphoryl diester phosphodiesterase